MIRKHGIQKCPHCGEKKDFTFLNYKLPKRTQPREKPKNIKLLPGGKLEEEIEAVKKKDRGEFG